MNGWMGKIVSIDLGTAEAGDRRGRRRDAAPVPRRPRAGRQALHGPLPRAHRPVRRRQRPDLHDRAADRHADDFGPLPGRLALAPDRDDLRFELRAAASAPRSRRPAWTG